MQRTLVATALALTACGLAAQEGTSWVDLQGGALMQKSSWTKSKDSVLKDGAIFGLGYGSWFTNRWGAEFSVLAATVDYKSKGMVANYGGKEAHAVGSLLFNLYPTSGWTPYLRAGIGGTHLGAELTSDGYYGKAHPNGKNAFNFHGGAGAQFVPSEHLILGLEARLTRIQTDVPARRSEGMVLASAGYRWGGSKPAPVPEPKPVPPPPPPPPAPKPEPLPPEPAPIPAPVPAPAPAPEPPPPPPPAPEPPKKIVLNNEMLHFPNGKADLGTYGLAEINSVAEQLKAIQGKFTLVVTGYTSSQGKAGFNKLLSKRRADAVAKVLVNAGIPVKTITTRGLGAEFPIASNKTPEGQAKNRRVEIDIKTTASNVEVKPVNR